MSWMGYTVRTSSFRYTEWTKWDGANCIAVWPETAPPALIELYDHREHRAFPVDFDGFENVNVANDPARAADVREHRELLMKRFKQQQMTGCPPDIGPDGVALVVSGLE